MDEEKVAENLNHVNHWNNIIYREVFPDNFVPLDDEALWNEFGIKSYPKFSRECASHIPDSWAEDVRQMIKEVRDKFGDKVTFAQIKEKWCRLTVYFDTELPYEPIDDIIDETVKRLQKKGLHP